MRKIKELNPRDINDFVPLIRVSPAALTKLKVKFAKDNTTVPEGNRIYYFSIRLDVEPALIAKYFSTHLFMFRLSFESLKEILDIVLEFEIPPVRILRDLWVFTYLPSSIRARLEHSQKTNKGNLKPWMIRCPEDVLERSLALTKDKQNLLGDGTIVKYMSQRLSIDAELMEVLIAKNEPLKKIKVAKVIL